MKFDKKYIAGRFPIIVSVALIVALAIVFCLVKTMVFDRTIWLEKKALMEEDSLEVKARRGDILSDDGQLLASSLPDYKIYIDFLSGLSAEGMKAKHPVTKGDSVVWCKKDTLFLQQMDSICSGLAEICPNMTKDAYKAHLQRGWKEGKRYYEICPHQVLNYLQYSQLMSLPFFRESAKHKYLVGLTIETRNNRKKPFGSLAQRTLGEMYGAKDSARSGLEQAYDSVLRGKPGMRHRKKVLSKYLDIIDEKPEDGCDLVTTINVGMQDVCEKVLREKLIELEALWGVVILEEVATGDIKAIVNLARNQNGTYAETRNWALAAKIEPGSTFKTASIMVALDDGKLKYSDTVDTGCGVYRMHGSNMKDWNWNRGGYHEIDVPHTLMYSSNVGVSRLIDERYHDCPEQFIEGLHRVGIAEPLGLPFNGVADPFLLTPGNQYWSKSALPWMSIGYSSQIPPISTVNFYNAIANGGKMMKPRFVKAIMKDGKVVEEIPTVVMKEQICRKQTLNEIQDALFRVVNDKDGTGKRAKSKRFHISGKTGTAQVSQGAAGYTSGTRQYLASFCGYYPSEAPKYTCIVALRVEGTGSGGGMAGPVFASIAEQVYSHAITTNLETAKDTMDVKSPRVKLGNPVAQEAVLSELGLHSDLKHTPVCGLNKMPDLIGMGARDAVYETERRGMKAALTGKGKVVSQSIAAGTEVSKGQGVTIKLEL